MASARPSTYRKGGGFLDGVDITLVDYQFTDEFNGEPFKAGKINGFDGKGKIDKPHNLNVLLTVRVDGADEDTTTTLKAAGDFDEWDVSEDGHAVTPLVDGAGFAAGTQWSKFVTSAVAAGFPEDELPEDEINYEAMLNRRYRLVQRVDEERTKKFGLKVDKKTGKGYERKDLVVDQYYGDAEEVKPAKSASSSKPVKGGKPAAAPAKGAKGKGAKDSGEVATAALKRYLDAADGSIAKSKIRMRVLTDKTFANQGDVRDEVIKWLHNDDNLEGIEGVEYDKADKAGIIKYEE